MFLGARRRSTAGDSSALRGSPNGGFLSLHPAPAVLVALSRRSSDCRAVIGSVLDAPREKRGRGHMVAAAPFAWPMAGSTRDRRALGNREQTPSLAAGSGLNVARAGPSPGAGHPGPRTRKRRALLCPIVSLSPPGRRFLAVRGSKSAFRLRYYRIPLIKCPGGPTSRSILIIGAGPIVIGQAASSTIGTQAAKALKEEVGPRPT